jgi:hypothetical protein
MSLVDSINFENVDTILSVIPKSECVARVLDIPTPATGRIAVMFTKFLTLMDHFLLHYSSRPCSPSCPCRSSHHQAEEKKKAENDNSEEQGKQQEEEEKEGKEEKKDYDGKNEKREERGSNTESHNKFRLDVRNKKHVTILRGLVPIFLDIMQHMGSILHGLNTCAVEQFARER